MALQKIDPTKIFKTCSTLDPAIDKDATGEKGIEEFEKSYDMKNLKFKEGEFPTIFHIKNILSSDEAKIKQDHMRITFPEKNNGELKSIKVSEMKPKIEQINSQEMLIKYFNSSIDNAEENLIIFPLKADNVPFSIVQEIGTLIMLRTQLGEGYRELLKS